MAGPVFLLCGGRTGGTFLADALARLPGMVLLYEPLYPELPDLVRQNPERSAAVLKHRTVRHHMRGYTLMNDVTLRALHAERGTNPEAYFRFLVEGAPGRPLIKLSRMYGRRSLLRDWFPDATFISLLRDPREQFRSMQRLNWPLDYFGMLSAFGVVARNRHAVYDEAGEVLFLRAWHLAKREAGDLAHLTLHYEDILRNPEHELGTAAVTLGYPPELGAELSHLVQPE